jgi:Zn-dependent M16 (insulinase) family peptidase
MDKNNIKKQLVERFVNEATPGIDVTKAVLTKSKAFNDEGLKDIEKKLKDAEKGQKKSQSKTKDMPQNKFNYNDDSEKEYHQEMEIMNGQEMIEYDRQPNQIFKERA